MPSDIGNNSAPQSGGFRAILEGYEIRSSSVSVSYGINELPSATVAITPHNILRRLRMVLGSDKKSLLRIRPKLQVFFMDNTVPTDHFKSEDDLGSFDDLKYWKLMFDGEVTGISMVKTPNNKQYMLVAQGQPYVLSKFSLSIFDMNSIGGLASDVPIAEGYNPNTTLLNVQGNKISGIIGQGWKTPEELARRVIGPVQVAYNSSADAGATMEDNSFEEKRIYSTQDVTASAADINLQFFSKHAMTKYYRKAYKANKIAQRFVMSKALSKFLYYLDTELKEKLNLAESLSNSSSLSDGSSNLLSLLIHSLNSYDFNVVFNSISSYVNDKKKRGGGLAYALLIPELILAHAPMCNVVFPVLSSQGGFTDDSDQVLTRARTQYLVPTALQSSDGLFDVMNEIYLAPKVLQEKRKKYTKSRVASRDNSDGDILTEEEKLRGIVERIIHVPPAIKFLAKQYLEEIEDTPAANAPNADAATKEKNYKIKSGSEEAWGRICKLLGEYAEFQYYLKKFEASGGTIGGVFNPNIVPGFPAVIVDSEDCGYHMVGYVRSVTHTMTPDNQVTGVSMSHLRTLEEDMALSQELETNSGDAARKFLTSDLSLKALGGVYKELLGCDVVDTSKLWEVVVIKDDEVVLGQSKVTDNSEYLSVKFPGYTDPARSKFESYSHALEYCKRPMIDMAQFYTDFIGDCTLHKVTSKANEVLVRVSGGPETYFNPALQEIIKVYFDSISDHTVYRG